MTDGPHRSGTVGNPDFQFVRDRLLDGGAGDRFEPAISLSAVRVGRRDQMVQGRDRARRQRRRRALADVVRYARQRKGVEIRYGSPARRPYSGRQRTGNRRVVRDRRGVHQVSGARGGARMRRLRGQRRLARAISRPSVGSCPGARHPLQSGRRSADGAGDWRDAVGAVERMSCHADQRRRRRPSATAS